MRNAAGAVFCSMLLSLGCTGDVLEEPESAHGSPEPGGGTSAGGTGGVSAACPAGTPVTVAAGPIRRLNRREYTRTVQQLLKIKTLPDVVQRLPTDPIEE